MAHEQSLSVLAAPGSACPRSYTRQAREAGLPCRSLHRHPDRAGGCVGHPAHRRRALGLLPAAHPAAAESGASASSSTSCRPARPTCRRPSIRCCWSGRRLGRTCAAARHLGRGGRQPAAGSGAGPRHELGARQPRHHPCRSGTTMTNGSAGRAAPPASVGDRSFIQTVPERADAARAGGSRALLDTAGLVAPLPRARSRGEGRGILDRGDAAGARLRAAVAGGCRRFCALSEEAIGPVQPIERYLRDPALLPKGDSARWFILDCIRQFVRERPRRRLGPEGDRPVPAGAAAREPSSSSSPTWWRSGARSARTRRSTSCS